MAPIGWLQHTPQKPPASAFVAVLLVQALCLDDVQLRLFAKLLVILGFVGLQQLLLLSLLLCSLLLSLTDCVGGPAGPHIAVVVSWRASVQPKTSQV